MKTKLLLLSLLTSVFATQIQAQDRTSVYAMNNEISDNLDLRAVASIFGDSKNLQDFERRLNDPKLQISNLDLNNDNEVDYLRVIETVENRTHVIIIQSVIDTDVYQDIATIDVEKDRNNKIHVQVVGDVYMYGQNYIYEPVYYSTPLIYASFWSANYRPYYSTWNWGYYPSYYYAWNPFPIFRYRNNINIRLNINNNYNYVNYRRSERATVLHNSRRSNGYERQHPNYSFSRRNTNVTNRYELDQRRGSKNEVGYSNRRTGSSRDYSQNRTSPSSQATPQRGNSQRDYSKNRTSPSSQATPQRGNSQRDYSQDRNNSSREAAPQRAQSQRDYSQNRNNSSREAAPQRAQSQNRGNDARQSAPQRNESQRNDNRRI